MNEVLNIAACANQKRTAIADAIERLRACLHSALSLKLVDVYLATSNILQLEDLM